MTTENSNEEPVIPWIAEANALTGETITRPFTAAETAAWYAEKALDEANPPTITTNSDGLAELREQVAELQSLVASLTKGVQTAP
jgi:hypothetical protein